MKIPAAKAAMDKEWEKLEKISAWNLSKIRSKREVFDEARTKGAKIHFASLMDICHLKSAELELKHQKYEGRVVLRGDIVKDDSGAHAVFTDFANDSSKSDGRHCEITRLCRTSRRRSISIHPSQNGGCSQIAQNFEVRVSRYMDTSSTTQVAQIMVKN